MGIFDRFNSREDLLKAVESAIVSQTVPGQEEGTTTEVFTLSDDSVNAYNDLKQKFETAVKDNQNYRKRAQTAESKVAVRDSGIFSV